MVNGPFFGGIWSKPSQGQLKEWNVTDCYDAKSYQLAKKAFRSISVK